MDIWMLISWGLWIAFYGGIGCLVAAVVSKVLGRDASKLFLSGLSAVAVSVFGWGIVASLAPGMSGGWDWMYLALAGGLLAISGIYFAVGRIEEGGKYMFFAVLVVGAMVFAFALSTGDLEAGGGLRVRVKLSATTIESGKALELMVETDGVEPMRYIIVDWGDGEVSEVTGCSKSWWFTHVYRVDGEPAKAFTITVNASDAYGRKGYNIVNVMVQNPGWCPYPWYLRFMCGLVQGVKMVLPGLDLTKLVTNPEFPTDPGNSIYGVYQKILAISMSALGLYLALGLAFGAFEGRVVEVFKDAVLALALALLMPHIYNASVGIMNSVSLMITPWIDPTGGAAAIVALGVAIGYFVPAVANLAALLMTTLVLLSAIVLVRYILIITIVAAFPLIAVASIHPLFRGIMKHCLSLLSGLVIAGPLTAVFLRILSETVPGGGIVLSFIYPIVGGILPNVLSMFGAGAATAIGGAIVSSVGKVVAARGKSTTSQQTTQMSPRTQVTKIARPAPIITPSMVKHAVGEARMRRKVFESLREMQELGPGIVATMEGFDRARQIEQEAKQELVHPRWESFKEFTKTLASQSWRQLRTNLRSLQSEFYQGLKHLAERELGVKLPESVRIGINSRAGEVGINSLSKYKQRKISRDLAFVSH
ncbi:MAG: hypothetical protein QXV81_06760 [Ignisphaera sp.]